MSVEANPARLRRRRVRSIALGALASGVVAFLVVPFLIPFETSGTLTFAEAAGPDAEFVTLTGIEVHLETVQYTGDSADPPVIVLLHGFGASTFSWREVLQPLAAVGDVIAYDRPGFGFTERPAVEGEGENPYGTPGNLELLDALLADIAPNREVIVVGHSAGGLIAAEYARLNSDTVDQLVLVAPAVYTTGGLPAWLAPFVGLPQIQRLGPILVQGIATSGEQLLEQSFVDQAVLTDAVREGYRAPLTVIGWEEGLWRFTTAPRDNGLVANLDGISQPTLLITGDSDTVVPTADTERLATELPGSELVIIPQSGHLPHEEAPEPFVDAVVEWLGLAGQ